MISRINEIIALTEEISHNIYMRSQKKVSELYITLLDSFAGFLGEMQTLGYQVDLSEELQTLQEAYVKKDFIEFSDLLLYKIKPEFEELRQNF